MFRWVLTLIAILLPASLFADGLIIIERPPHIIPGHFPFAPLEIGYHRVDVKIDAQVAVTTVDQEFINPGGARLEGTYLFPLPAGAHIDKFAMDIDGKMAEAELLSADKARSIYEDIVRRHRDPALLEYIGRDAFKVRIFPDNDVLMMIGQSRNNSFSKLTCCRSGGAQNRYNADFIKKRGQRSHEVRFPIDHGAFTGDVFVAVDVSIYQPSPFFFILILQRNISNLGQSTEEPVCIS
jgi:hypothetical protein